MDKCFKVFFMIVDYDYEHFLDHHYSDITLVIVRKASELAYISINRKMYRFLKVKGKDKFTEIFLYIWNQLKFVKFILKANETYYRFNYLGHIDILELYRTFLDRVTMQADAGSILGPHWSNFSFDH